MRCLVWTILLALVAGACGCGEKVETDQERLKRLVPNAGKTTKVSGKVTVDGVPARDIWVKLIPVKSEKGEIIPKAQTGEDGTFRIMTYLEGDGAPPGEYNVTLEWLTYRTIGSQWVGPDKLKNQYNDPTTTSIHVVVADTPVEIPPVDAKVEGVTAKPPSKYAAPSPPEGTKWVKPNRK